MENCNRPRVQILLATYNSTKFLRKQLDSIFAQDYQNFQLLIRDGGSVDATLDIINEYQKRYEGMIEFVGSQKANAIQNFSALLTAASADYIMFSDHDDVWFPNKISATLNLMLQLEKLHSKNTPLLIHAESLVTDEKLQYLGKTGSERQRLNPRRSLSNQLLLQNVAPGNTMLVNAALKKLAVPIPDSAVMHDHWCMLVASVFGIISYCNTPVLYYRQHGDNIFGAPEVSLYYYYRLMLQGRAKLRERFYTNIRQGQAFYERYKEQLDSKQKKLFEAVSVFESLSYYQKCKILFQFGIFKNGFWRNVGIFFIL